MRSSIPPSLRTNRTTVFPESKAAVTALGGGGAAGGAAGLPVAGVPPAGVIAGALVAIAASGSVSEPASDSPPPPPIEVSITMPATSSTPIRAIWASGFSLSFSRIERPLISSALLRASLNSAVCVGRRGGRAGALDVRLSREEIRAADVRRFESFVLDDLGVVAQIDRFAHDRAFEGRVVFHVDVRVRCVEDELVRFFVFSIAVVGKDDLRGNRRRTHYVEAHHCVLAFARLVATRGDVCVVFDLDLGFAGFHPAVLR